MAFFTLRLPDELASRFDAAARPMGGRSAALRRLIAEVAGSNARRTDVPVRRGVACKRIELRFSDAELAAIDTRAAERGLKRSDWIVSLILARAAEQTPPARDVQSALIDAWRQLKRIGINLNQAVHAVNSAMMEGSRFDLLEEAERIAPFRDEVAIQLAAIGQALDGDLSYWRSEP